jgi:endonuclease YncB( thermonuclease family)
MSKNNRRPRKPGRLTLLSAAALGLTYLLVPASGPGAAAPSRTVAAAAGIHVVDGDTFHYRGEKIRVADIDTPEVRGRCAHETQLAARATRRMGQLLAAGPFDLQRVGRDEDRYGRKLRVVTRNGRSLGDQLVAEGLARTWSGRREPWC